MAILSKGQTFANGDEVTSEKLNNLVDQATFVAGASGTTDDSSLEVNGSGRLQIKDSGVSSGKIAAGAVGTAKVADATSTTDGITFPKIRHIENMKVIGNVSGSTAAPAQVSILDEDNMASDSATAIPTQQSVKAYVDGTLDTSTNGYAILPTGLIMQWGYRASINGTITFPYTFPTACRAVTVGSDNSASYIASVESVTASGFTCRGIRPGVGFGNASNVYWQAIGY